MNWADRRSYTKALQRLGIDAAPTGQSYVPATQLSYVLADALNMRPVLTRIFGHASLAATPAIFNGLIFQAGPDRGLFVDQLEVIVSSGAALWFSLVSPVAGPAAVLTVNACVSTGTNTSTLLDPAGAQLAEGCAVYTATSPALAPAVIEAALEVSVDNPLLRDGLQRRVFVPPSQRGYLFTQALNTPLAVNFDTSLGLG